MAHAYTHRQCAATEEGLPDPAQVYVNPEMLWLWAWKTVTWSRSNHDEVPCACARPYPDGDIGQVFMSMHYPLTNRLTLPVFDTYSRQPAYKSAAVALRRPQAEGGGRPPAMKVAHRRNQGKSTEIHG